MAVMSDKSLASAVANPSPLMEGFIDQGEQIQPNGIDLSVRAIHRFVGAGSIDFSNEERVLPATEELEPDGHGWYELSQGCFLVMFNEIVNLPNDTMAIGRPRSSMLRAGATVESAVWDAGYQGRSQSLIVVHASDGIRIKKDARVLQLVFMKLEAESKGYEGQYQGENISR